ncbi:MAG: ABC transporter permease [Terracidiphilus sp.]
MFRLLQDVRFALRKFRQAPGPILAAMVTLAFGIGANSAIFSIADAIWLRPLPITDPSHLVALASVKNHASADSEGQTESSYTEFNDVRQRVPAFSDVAAHVRMGVNLETPDGLQNLLTDVVSDNYFAFMGVRPELGRLPSENELRHTDSPVIILGHAAWKSIFAGDPSVVGRTVTVNRIKATVLAVLPAEFHGTEPMIDPQVYVPQSSWVILRPGERNAPRTDREYELFARLRPGAMLDQANAQLQRLSSDLSAGYPEANAGRSLTADWQQKSHNGFKALSILLLAIAGVVLLIACVNIANLLLSLNDARRREIAMRIALGATRGQILRQFVTEYALLALAGVAGALLLARGLISLLPAVMPNIGFPLGFDFRIDHRVLAFTAASGVLSVLIYGIFPAIKATRSSPLDAMRAQPAPTGKLKMPARKVFVVAQLAASMALLTVMGLLVRTLIDIETADQLGFNSRQNAVFLDIGLPGQGTELFAKYGSLVDRMKALPGAAGASIARVVPLPLSEGGMTKVVLMPGELPSPTAGMPVWFNSIDNDYMRLMGIPIQRGRAFDRRDTPSSERVTIVNETLAKKLYGSVDVVGRNLRIGRQNPVDMQIVGVARDGKYNDLSEAPQPYLYFPLAQDVQGGVNLIVFTAGKPGTLLPAIRRTLREVDPACVVLNTETLTDHMRFAAYTQRVAAWLSASLGGLALLLTVVGLYGVMAYSVSRRTHEIGIRMALGALRVTVFGAVLKDGLILAAAGIGVGAGLALLAGHGIRSFLYGVKPMDPFILLGVAALILVTSAAAAIAPARRAVLVDPNVALHEE